MDNPQKSKVKVSSLSRVILSEENGRHLQEWLGQLRESCPGIRIKKQDLVNWLVGERGPRLCAADLKSLRERFFNEIELAQWALGQLKAAKARNEKLTLADLIRGGKLKEGVISPRKERAKSTPKSAAEMPPIEGNRTDLAE